jgi:hypothetical protein
MALAKTARTGQAPKQAPVARPQGGSPALLRPAKAQGVVQLDPKSAGIPATGRPAKTNVAPGQNSW